MNNHDPGTHNGMLMGAIFDVLRGNRSKSSSLWVRLGLGMLRLSLIGLLMASPFIVIVLLVVLFS